MTGGESNLFLMNPSGIIFGADAQLNLPASFMATTATGIGFDGVWFNASGSNDYLNLSGNPTHLDFGSTQAGVIVNIADLAVATGESLSLVGGSVLNQGSLTAPGGNITIAAVPGTNRVQLSQEGSLLRLEFPITRDETGELLPVRSFDLHQLLTTGQLADQGLVAMGDAYVRIVDPITGLPIVPGMAIVSGSVDVSNIAPGAVGGEALVLGDKVGLLNGTIDASGDAGGGLVRIGGDFQGQGSLPNARVTVVDQNSSIFVDALSAGDGGRAIVWADDLTQFGGSLSATGGARGGDGGFAEISGKDSLVYRGSVDLSAAQGLNGTVLFDPKNIIIATGGTDAIAVNSLFTAIA